MAEFERAMEFYRMRKKDINIKDIEAQQKLIEVIEFIISPLLRIVLKTDFTPTIKDCIVKKLREYQRRFYNEDSYEHAIYKTYGRYIKEITGEKF